MDPARAQHADPVEQDQPVGQVAGGPGCSVRVPQAAVMALWGHSGWIFANLRDAMRVSSDQGRYARLSGRFDVNPPHPTS